jgi:hypothetical protein
MATGYLRTRATQYAVIATETKRTIFSSTSEREAVQELRTRRELNPTQHFTIHKTRTTQRSATQ